MKASGISLEGPVAMGFSINRATPGKCFRIWSSMSRACCVVPRNIGGLPTTNARGASRRAMFFTKSSSVRKTRVFSYALRTNVSHFFCSTAVARSTAGSMSATTLRRGPSLLGEERGQRRDARQGAAQAYCSKRNEWFQGPSSDPARAVVSIGTW